MTDMAYQTTQLLLYPPDNRMFGVLLRHPLGSAPSHLGLAGQIRRSTSVQGVPLLAEVEVLWLP